MSTKAYYPLNEIGAGRVGFSKTRSIIEAAFYGNNVVKVNTLKEAYWATPHKILPPVGLYVNKD